MFMEMRKGKKVCTLNIKVYNNTYIKIKSKVIKKPEKYFVDSISLK